MNDRFDGSSAPPGEGGPTGRIAVADRFLDRAWPTRLGRREAALADSPTSGAQIEGVGTASASHANVDPSGAVLRDVTLAGAAIERADARRVGLRIDGIAVTDLLAARHER